MEYAKSGEWTSAMAGMRRELGPQFERDFGPQLRTLAADPLPVDPAERLRLILDAMDAFLTTVEAKSSAKTACGPNCPFCCTTEQILVSELEAVLLVRAINSLPAQRRAEVSAQVRRSRPTVNKPQVSQCSMLGKDGLCSIHPSRPSTCRTYLSTSRKACKLYSFGRSPHPDTIRAYPYLVYEMTREACVRDVEERVGGDVRIYELNTLMRRILSDAAKTTAWSKGQPTVEADIVLMQAPRRPR